ncbi:hypothetical protein D3C73_909340 [compost metagenome]
MTLNLCNLIIIFPASTIISDIISSCHFFFSDKKVPNLTKKTTTALLLRILLSKLTRCRSGAECSEILTLPLLKIINLLFKGRLLSPQLVGLYSFIHNTIHTVFQHLKLFFIAILAGTILIQTEIKVKGVCVNLALQIELNAFKLGANLPFDLQLIFFVTNLKQFCKFIHEFLIYLLGKLAILPNQFPIKLLSILLHLIEIRPIIHIIHQSFLHLMGETLQPFPRFLYDPINLFKESLLLLRQLLLYLAYLFFQCI